MTKRNKLKILNDPIYGFVSMPNEFIFDLIEHQYFQRLRRITQMGMSHLVYPGAHHTRFHHAIGCMHLMKTTIDVLRRKRVPISQKEEEALLIAILLHDIGHGPFSHAMEHSIVNEVSHEEISLLFMKRLNEEFKGKLSMAIEIFQGNYSRKFMHQLISSQLDMDRMDYLKRDSFYTGVYEGNINSERLISMLNVQNDQLVIEQKGIYSVEKLLISRRLMYWQVYLHKTSIVAENILTNILRRAKYLTQQGEEVSSGKALMYFIKNYVTKEEFSNEILDIFSKLDDYDIMSSVKEWSNHHDFVLRKLCNMLINRHLLKIEISKMPFNTNYVLTQKHVAMLTYGISIEEADYFVFTGMISNQAYNKEYQNINVLDKGRNTRDISEASDHYNLEALSMKVTKHFMCSLKL